MQDRSMQDRIYAVGQKDAGQNGATGQKEAAEQKDR